MKNHAVNRLGNVMTTALLSACSRNPSMGWDVCVRGGVTGRCACGRVRLPTVPARLSPTTPPVRSRYTDRWTGSRARHSTAHQDDAAALLRIRFMWTLCFGSYMILLPSAIIDDDDIYWRPVVLFMWFVRIFEDD